VDESKLTIHMHQYAIIAIARQLAHHRVSFKDV
jgi:hypothetical protein